MLPTFRFQPQSISRSLAGKIFMFVQVVSSKHADIKVGDKGEIVKKLPDGFSVKFHDVSNYISGKRQDRIVFLRDDEVKLLPDTTEETPALAS